MNRVVGLGIHSLCHLKKEDVFVSELLYVHIRLIRDGQDGHLDFHTAPELLFFFFSHP